ncbi:MAG: homocysteine S-methyltransferase family protein [Pseudomonadota bacterium]
MTRYDRFMARLAAGEAILIDGATGTEIDRRGTPRLEHAWTGGGAVSHPEILLQVHRDYLRAGAEIVISNTFATCRHCLEAAGVGNDFELYNRRGVELAMEAREAENAQDALVAGGISYWSFTDEQPPLDELRASVGLQAAVMRDAGADLLMLEMMVGIERMIVTLEAAQTSGLPVWAGLSCAPDDAGTMRLLDGDSLADALEALKGRDVQLVSIMHTFDYDVDACLDVVGQHWDGLTGVYAHTSSPHEGGKWEGVTPITPDEYAAAARRWLARDVRLIGGCCGIATEHIAVLREVVEERDR